MEFSSISIILPAFNEENNIGKTIDQIYSFVSKIFLRFEIIVVNDGSTDKTAHVLDEKNQKYDNLKIIKHASNEGYGSTIKDGLVAATMELIFFMDSDGQFDIADIRKLLDGIERYDAVIGYRDSRKDNVLRKLLGKSWSSLVNFYLGIKHRDIDCAFKLFTQKSIQKIDVRSLYSQGAGINAEILLKMKQKGLKTLEVPVTHFPRTSGRPSGAHPKVIAKALRELIELKKYTR